MHKSHFLGWFFFLSSAPYKSIALALVQIPLPQENIFKAFFLWHVLLFVSDDSPALKFFCHSSSWPFVSGLKR